MKKRVLSVIMAVGILAGFGSAAAADGGFSDVPGGDWAGEYISKASELGIMNGYGDGRFGYGDSVTRAQFAAMLTRLFGWEPAISDSPSFSDNSREKWHHGEVEAAVKNGAVLADTELFRPDDNITRGEMAVMLVRALGYDALAGQLESAPMPFTDIGGNRAYIAMAYDFRIINGISDTMFGPDQCATREQAAAMMIRLYDSYTRVYTFRHAFYAISSYSQKDAIAALDAVTFGWSRMEYHDGPVLNTKRSPENDYGIPDGYEEVIALAKSGGTKAHLGVYMSALRGLTLSDGTATNPCAEILTNSENRTSAVAQIVAELTRGDNFTGVTIDFEEMRGGALRSGLNAFLGELRAELDTLGMTLYVCVHPVTADGAYYDAYDYRAIGELADRVILMAHDYAATSLTESEMASGFVWTPVTPIASVYSALRAAVSESSGVADSSKLLLAFSMNYIQWERSEGAVVNKNAYRPQPDAIYSRMTSDVAALGYSEIYENPYITYTDDNGHDHILWYEDARSISAKAGLARMFGVTGFSVWRLGIIPNYGAALHFNVLDTILELS
ncbi:MAG: hypothetical protein GX823_04160 [Clostridiales bacterium]|nr:hypothetical protein [Clostridiales bacterium]